MNFSSLRFLYDPTKTGLSILKMIYLCFDTDQYNIRRKDYVKNSTAL